MMSIKKLFVISSIAFAVLINGCKKADPKSGPNTPGAYGSGIFVTCEGLYGSGTGTVSFYNRSTGIVNNDIFQTANSFPLGNVVQSMNVFNGKAYVVVNNSNKVEVVNAGDFKSSGTITGVSLPRYFLGINNNKAYVTEWGSTGMNGAIKVINLPGNTVSSTINTGKGAEKMVRSGNSVYVTCKGGYDNDSVVTVINTLTDAVSTTIKVGPNPDGIQQDANGKIWVLCGGRWNSTFTTLAETGKLVRIDPATNNIEQVFTFTSTASTPSNLSINGAKNKLYYTYQGGIYTLDISASGLSSTAFIGRSFYGLGVDPVTDYIYGADAGNYSSNGYVIRYNTIGSKVDSFLVGIIPGSFFFK